MFWQIAQMLRGNHNNKFIIIQFTVENLNGTIGKHIINIFKVFFSYVRVYDPQMRVIYVWVMISEWWKTCCVCLLNLAWPPQCGHHATIWTARNTIGPWRIFTVCLWCMYHRHHNLMIIVRTWTCVSTDQISRSPHCQAPMIHGDKWSLQFTEHVSSQQPDYFTFHSINFIGYRHSKQCVVYMYSGL